MTMIDDLTKHQARLELNSLLLSYESRVVKLYDLQRADRDPADFEGMDRDATITKLKAAINKVREAILAYAERGIEP